MVKEEHRDEVQAESGGCCMLGGPQACRGLLFKT